MLTSFQYRLQQHESDPPTESWPLILLRLNDELNTGDIEVSKKVNEFKQVAPDSLWSKINARLSQPEASDSFYDLPAHLGWPSGEPAENKVSLIESTISESVGPSILEIKTERERRSPVSGLSRFNWPRLAMAAAVAGIAISALYYFVSEKNTVRQFTTTNPANSETAESGLPESIPGNDLPVVRSPGASMAITSGAGLLRKRAKGPLPVQAAYKQASYQQASDRPEFSNTDINYANINATDPVISEKNISIPTEPIRDNSGNIIMDEKLISAPDKNYVTVTGPNGVQTKISKKFLHALSYMNAGTDDDQMGIALQESSLWKWLFKEWRQKLLKQPSFIPSSTNFLDIIELKEILHENF